jgi:hypothetical protein
MTSTCISSIGTICIELWKKISSMGRNMLGKNHEEWFLNYGKKAFEKNHGKQMVSITSIFVTCPSIFIIFLITLIKNTFPFVFPKVRQGGLLEGMKCYSIEFNGFPHYEDLKVAHLFDTMHIRKECYIILMEKFRWEE